MIGVCRGTSELSFFTAELMALLLNSPLKPGMPGRKHIQSCFAERHCPSRTAVRVPWYCLAARPFPWPFPARRDDSGTVLVVTFIIP